MWAHVSPEIGLSTASARHHRPAHHRHHPPTSPDSRPTLPRAPTPPDAASTATPVPPGATPSSARRYSSVVRPAIASPGAASLPGVALSSDWSSSPYPTACSSPQSNALWSSSPPPHLSDDVERNASATTSKHATCLTKCGLPSLSIQ
jgi:hypothetical protein